MFGRTSKKKVAADINWRKLEKDLVKSNHFNGYKVQEQKVFRSVRKRPDIFGINKKNPKDRIVADAKCVTELTKSHVDQVKGYKRHPGYAKKGLIGVCKDTRVPHKVRSYAKKSNIKIERRQIKRKKGFLGL